MKNKFESGMPDSRSEPNPEAEIFAHDIVTWMPRSERKTPEDRVANALIKVGCVRRNTEEAKKYGYWVCANYRNRLRMKLAAILAQHYGREKLERVVAFCRAGMPEADRESADIMLDAIRTLTPHIHMNWRRPISSYYT